MKDIVNVSLSESQVMDDSPSPEDLLDLLNSLFNCLSKNRLQSLRELANDSTVLLILSEMEPSFKCEMLNASSFGLQYSNYLSLLKTMEDFIKANCQKDRLTSKANLVETININLLLKENKQMLISIAQVLFFISSISANKEVYIEKVSDFKTSSIRLYFSSIDAFIQIDSDDFLKKSSILLLDQTDNSVHKNKREQYDNIISQLEKTNHQLKQSIEALEKKANGWEVKYISKCSEVEMIKKSNERSLQIQEQMLQVTLKNAELLSEVNQKNILIEQLNDVITANANKSAYERQSLKSEKEQLADKLNDYKELREQYSRLSVKYQDLTNVKGNSEIEGLASSLEQKDKQIELFIKEKTVLMEKIEKINNDNYALLEANRKKEKLIKQYQETIKELQANCEDNASHSLNQISIKQYKELMMSNESQMTIEGQGIDASKLKEYEEARRVLIKDKDDLKEELKNEKALNGNLSAAITEAENNFMKAKKDLQIQINLTNKANNQLSKLQGCLDKANEAKSSEFFQLEASLKVTQSELQAIKTSHALLAEKYSQLEAISNESTLNKENHLIQLKEKEDQLQSLIKDNKQLKDTTLQLETQLKEKGDLINNLLQTINLLRESTASVSAELKSKVEGLTAENAQLKVQVAQLDEELKNAAKEVNITRIDPNFPQMQSILLNNDTDEFANEITGYQEEIREKSEIIRKLELKITGLSTSLSEIEKQNTQLLLSQQQQQQQETEALSKLNLESNSMISETLFTFAFKLLNG